MKGWPYFLIVIVILGTVMNLLYNRGLVITKRIAAVLFLFRPGRDRDRASLNSCTGWVRHVGRFPECRTYEFSLDARLTQGDVEVALLDAKKQPLWTLNRQSPARRVDLDGKSRYYLRWEFKNATGTCDLHW